MHLQSQLTRIRAEELLGRFRSKEDLYKYMTNQSKILTNLNLILLVGLYLPSYHGTKVGFIKALLNDQKQALQRDKVILTEIPRFEELSVKNLYNDAINDQIVGPYLPSLEMNSNRIPERDFFFGVLGTLKPDYLKKIIKDANEVRFQVGDQGKERDCIMIKDDWLQELIKHPYFSRKIIVIISVGKPGKAIFLMKERTKIVRAKKTMTKHEVSHRLSDARVPFEERKESSQSVIKRRKTKESTNPTQMITD